MELDLKEVAAVEAVVTELDNIASQELANLHLAYMSGGLGETAI